MTFKVEPAALEGYSAQAARARDHAADCKTYFGGNVGDIAFSEGGVINPLYYEHGGVKAKVDAMLTHLHDLLEKSRLELGRAAKNYRETDRESAAKVDESYPLVARPSARKD
ncbi:hypothetical protein [Actinoplanes sp. NPDC049316]|uniref:hypothetical protein n=1 Tax=Actinoplanes sp. NPDC049316 TaxID=3154727 RepID=UPI0034298527